jgi:uncharacterized protein (DUF983 family)
MASGSQMPAALAMLRQMCPRCRSATIFQKSIFTGFPHMRERCLKCDLKFEREPGYFLGAMYIGYGLALIVIVGFGLLLWLLTSWTLMRISFWAILLFLPLAPTITLFARVLWIYLDQSIDPELPAS